jgi:hypothetical protein
MEVSALGALQNGVSALPPKADMCGAIRDVCFGPRADMLRGVMRFSLSGDRQRFSGAQMSHRHRGGFFSWPTKRLLRGLAKLRSTMRPRDKSQPHRPANKTFPAQSCRCHSDVTTLRPGETRCPLWVRSRDEPLVIRPSIRQPDNDVLTPALRAAGAQIGEMAGFAVCR